jgi:hypothetical protein
MIPGGWEYLEGVGMRTVYNSASLFSTLLSSSVFARMDMSSHCFTSVLLVISSDACVAEVFHSFVGGYIHSLMVIGRNVGSRML